MAGSKPNAKPEEVAVEETSTSTAKEVRVKYTGPSVHRRVLDASDAKKAGVDGFSKTEWNPENNHTVTFTDPPKGLVEWLEGMKQFKVLSPGEI